MRAWTSGGSLLILLLLAASMSACDRGEPVKTQVVARVNGEEITVSQLNQALAAMGPGAGADADAAAKMALENLIRETLGVQAALKMKLDRDPAILGAIEAAKRRVLLDAFLGRVLQNTPPPTPSEVHAFFSLHPELFAERRLYVFNQLTAKAGKESVASLARKVASVNNLREFVAWLKEHGVDYTLSSDVRSSGELNAGMLGQMQKLRAGDLGYLSATDGVVAIEMERIIRVPLTEHQAQPFIEHYLFTQKEARAAQQAFQEMRADATVQYVGKFKDDEPAQAAQMSTAIQRPQSAPEAHFPKAAPHVRGLNTIQAYSGGQVVTP